MWLFTRYGFYSIACARRHDGSRDTETVMIRARLLDHLRNLQERFKVLLDKKILTTRDRDYRYRLIVSKDVWRELRKTVGVGLVLPRPADEPPKKCRASPGVG